MEVDSTGRHKHLGPKLKPGSLEPRGKDRADPGRLQFAYDLAMLTDACLLELEDIRQHHDVTLHAHDLGDGGHFSGAILQTRLLDDEVDRRRDLLPDYFQWEVHACHQHHGFHTRDCIAWGVGM